jgi:hypothetical protein
MYNFFICKHQIQEFDAKYIFPFLILYNNLLFLHNLILLL